MNIKQLLQDEADKKRAIAAAKKTGRELFAIAEKDRTPEQATKLTATVAEIDALETSLEGIQANLDLARKLQDDERKSGNGVIEVGKNHAEDKPWGPQVA